MDHIPDMAPSTRSPNHPEYAKIFDKLDQIANNQAAYGSSVPYYPTYGEVKTNDVIPTHSGSAQTFEAGCDSADCCHAQGGLTCYWDGWECNCHTFEEAPIYTEVKTNDLIPTHSGSAQTSDPTACFREPCCKSPNDSLLCCLNISGPNCKWTPWGCFCPDEEPIYTEVKTNDVIPTHSGSAQIIEPNCDSAECCHAYSGITCYWNGWACNCHTLEEESPELSSTAKKMMMVNFWSGFISELEGLNAENMEGCINYSDSAFTNLL